MEKKTSVASHGNIFDLASLPNLPVLLQSPISVNTCAILLNF